MALNKPARYVLFVVALLLSLHALLSLTHAPYGNATSLSGLFSPSSSTLKYTDDTVPAYGDSNTNSNSNSSSWSDWANGGGTGAGNTTRANATFVMLARNSDVHGAVQTIRSIEDRFNREHGYPYVFLNEEPWTDEFKKRISALSHAPMEFGVIPHDWWFQPDWIDEPRAKPWRSKGSSTPGPSPTATCAASTRGFSSGMSCWRSIGGIGGLNPTSCSTHCTLAFDLFKYMQEHDKVYAFTIALYEWSATIPTLWDTVKEFMKQNPSYVVPDNAMGFLSENGGQDFNMCHFWSNFEIADMDFWRSEVYTKFFEFLDKTGGFYYERWGDAPVHSIAVSLFLPKAKIHFFNEIGYEHPPNAHCPLDDDMWRAGMCSCDQGRTHDYGPYSCQHQWDRIFQ